MSFLIFKLPPISWAAGLQGHSPMPPPLPGNWFKLRKTTTYYLTGTMLSLAPWRPVFRLGPRMSIA